MCDCWNVAVITIIVEDENEKYITEIAGQSWDYLNAKLASFLDNHLIDNIECDTIDCVIQDYVDSAGDCWFDELWEDLIEFGTISLKGCDLVDVHITIVYETTLACSCSE
jgi:hypothetical protein